MKLLKIYIKGHLKRKEDIHTVAKAQMNWRLIGQMLAIQLAFTISAGSVSKHESHPCFLSQIQLQSILN